MFHIVVCGGIVPDPLQTLEPVKGPTGWGLKNEMMLPSILDPWASHALYEAAHLAKAVAGSKVWLVSLGPKAKLQQLMMTVAQKAPFELVVADGPASGFTDSFEVAEALHAVISGIADLDALTGKPFDAAAFARVPQFLYMGDADDNDSLDFGACGC